MFKQIRKVIELIIKPFVTVIDIDQLLYGKDTSNVSSRDFEYASSVGPELVEHMKLPSRGTECSAGYDFYNNTGKDIVIKPRSRTSGPRFTKVIASGIKVYMLPDEYLEIVPRSSLGFKYGLSLANTCGVIDADYYGNPKNEGEIFFKLVNNSKSQIVIKKGEAFAQGIFKKYLTTDTDYENVGGKREGGIGSTNK